MPTPQCITGACARTMGGDDHELTNHCGGSPDRRGVREARFPAGPKGQPGKEKEEIHFYERLTSRGNIVPRPYCVSK